MIQAISHYHNLTVLILSSWLPSLAIFSDSKFSNLLNP